MFAGREGDFPVVVRKTFPPFEFDNAFEAEIRGEVADAPGHDADFRMREAAECGFVKMIKVRVREEDEVYGRQVLDFEAGAFDAFEEKEPVGKVRVNQDVEVRELEEEGGVADPGDGDLAVVEFGKFGFAMLAGASGEECFPHHFVKEGARIEMFGRREVFEGFRQFLAG
jgi:hypothetical protein